MAESFSVGDIVRYCLMKWSFSGSAAATAVAAAAVVVVVVAAASGSR